MKEKINRKGFAQIYIIITIIIATILTSGSFLYSSGKLDSLISGSVLYNSGKLGSLFNNVSQTLNSKDTNPLSASVETTEEIKPFTSQEEKHKEENQSAEITTETIKKTNSSQVSDEEWLSLPAPMGGADANNQCSSDLVFCNKLCWTKCSEGQKFYCLPTRAQCCPSNLFCNDKCWTPCPTGQTFTCPITGDPYCSQSQCSSDLVLCNGICWKKCSEGQQFHCLANGAQCCIPSLFCNGQCWTQCPAGQNFHCLQSGAACCTPDLFCQNQCWTPCKTGDTFVCPLTEKPYCLTSHQAPVKEKVETGTDTNLYQQFLATILQYQKDQQSKLDDCYQRRTAEIKAKNDKISAIDVQIDALNAQADSICPNQFSEVCMVGSIRRQLEDINLQIRTLINKQIGISNQDILTVCSPSDISHYPDQPYIPLNYYSSSNLPTIYQIMPNSMGGYTVSSNDYRKSWTISPNNTGGYKIYDQNFNSWNAIPNGMGGYTILRQ